MMTAEKMVAKPYVETNRITRLIAFVDAHFDCDTGEPVSGGFYEVLNRLGRTDLDFGTELRELGALDESEKKYAKKVYTEKLKLARNPKQKKRVIEKSKSLWSDLHANPFYKQLSPVARLIFEAFDSEGMIVINPAAATTLAQAAIENWFEVPQLLLTTTDILCQASEQGDSHAAYLLGTAVSPKGQILFTKSTDRENYLDFANRLGHSGARDAIAEAEAYESGQSDAWKEVVPDEWYSDWAEAKKEGPNASGERLLKLAETLLTNALRLYIQKYPGFTTIDQYEKQKQIAREWIERAAFGGCIRAWHSLAEKFQHKTDNERINLLKKAASPGVGRCPFYPALVDLVEHYAQPDSSTTDFNQANDFLELAIQNVPVDDTENWIRILDLVEVLDKKTLPKDLYGHYLKYANYSAYSAFRAGLIALRACTSEKQLQECADHFQNCLQFGSKEYINERDETSLIFAEVALKIGWGDWENKNDWDSAAMLLVFWLKKNNFQHCSEQVWLNGNDINTLFNFNSAYHRFNSVRNERLSTSNISDGMMKFLANKHFAIGNSDPLGYIKGLITIYMVRNISTEKLKVYDMNPDNMLTAFLFGELYLAHRFGENKQARALTHFEQVWHQIKSRQSNSGGESNSFEARALIYLESWTHIGLMNSQPSVRQMNIRDELDGSVQEFGAKLISKILDTLGKDNFPTDSPVVDMKYNDQYLFTPFTVALLGGCFFAFKEHFKFNNRWQVENVKVVTAVKYGKNKQPWSESPAFNCEWPNLQGRDSALTATLLECGIDLKIESDFVQHERLLSVVFKDGSLLNVKFDKGMSDWKAVLGGEDRIDFFSFQNTPDSQGKALFRTKVAVGRTKTRAVSNSSDSFIPCSVEWRGI